MFLFFMLITIATFNVNGLRDDIKRKCIFKHLLDCNFHITLLQETHTQLLQLNISGVRNGPVIVHGHTAVALVKGWPSC